MTKTNESSEEYENILFKIDMFRVILCRDRIQFILQKVSGEGTKRQWHSKSYCTCRKSLARCWRDKVGITIPDELLALPERAG